MRLMKANLLVLLSMINPDKHNTSSLMIKQKRDLALLFCAALFPIGDALSLELGFEATAVVEATDNVEGAATGFEEDGQIGFGSFTIYGEQLGRVVQGGFSGEIESRKVLSDDDDNFDALTRFLGAVNVGITPRTVSWYFGDILGSVRADDGIQQLDDDDLPRRNVFVTGPEFDFDLGAFSSANARLLYVHQSDEEGEIATLYNFAGRWQTETARGSTWGIRLGDIYTDPTAAVGAADMGDFNRLSTSVFWERNRLRNNIAASIGATRYTTDDDSVSGLNAALNFTRLLDAQQSLTLELSRDLQDQTLATIESLIDDGNGVEPESSGIFAESRLGLRYNFLTSGTSVEVGSGVVVADYMLMSSASETDINNQDQTRPFAYGVWTQTFSPRLSTEVSLSYEQREFDNFNASSASLLLSTSLSYRLSRSFSLELGYAHDRADDLRTQLDDNGVPAAPENIDVVENSASIGLRWAPPSRASRRLTIELKSLLN